MYYSDYLLVHWMHYFWTPFIGYKKHLFLWKDTKNEIQRIFVSQMKVAVIFGILAIAYTLNNGLALTPPMVTVLE